MQYYVSGRSAVFAQSCPVCANLLHHAVEMFLKVGLADLGLNELRDEVSALCWDFTFSSAAGSESRSSTMFQYFSAGC